MSSFEWTAKRALRSSSVAGEVYSIDIDTQAIDPSVKSIAKEHIALGGNSEALGHRIDQIWRLKTSLLNDLVGGEFAAVNELMQSVLFGESFYFDAYGTLATPLNAQKVKIVQNTYKFKRENNITGSSAGTWSASFSLRVVD